jgi:hypothetical protein
MHDEIPHFFGPYSASGENSAMIDDNELLRTVPSLQRLNSSISSRQADWRGAAILTMKREADERHRNFGITELLCEWIPHLSIRRSVMDGIIYLVGLIVIVLFILSFLGLH